MQINITNEEFYREKASRELVSYLRSHEQELGLNEATLYYKYPLFKELDEELQCPSVVLVSPNHGIMIFQCIDAAARELSDARLEQIDQNTTQVYSLIYSKLVKTRSLRSSKDRLSFDIIASIYLPYCTEKADKLHRDELENDPAFSTNQVRDLLAHNRQHLGEGIFKEVLSILEGSKGIIKPKPRDIPEGEEHTKGGIMASLEKEMAYFDAKQKSAAMTQLSGPQRIRGLAGSGKTIVLAWKAAMLHFRNPDAMILYTFYTKSLYDHIKKLITRFYRLNQEVDPDWSRIHIRHAWGGKSLPGVYYEACRANGVVPLPLAVAKQGNMKGPFEYACRKLLEEKGGELEKAYDYVLMDEGQDFPRSFYHLCRAIVEEDNLVWAYDELQEILDVRMQSTTELFKDDFGHEGIDLSKLQENHPEMENDIVLPKCYRNPREVLVVAHAIGFGIYNDKMVQMLENKEHWHDVGYIVEQGNCQEGERTRILRPAENSPLSISAQQTKEEIIKTYVAGSMEDEVDWVCESIQSDILEQRLRPDDILVICIDDHYASKYFRLISECLYSVGILSNNVLDSILGDTFFIEGRVTMSTVYRAKGNEAAMVYLIGVDTFAQEKDSRLSRNKLFTAFTRTKAWLRVSGMDSSTKVLVSEVEEALENCPYLVFDYPSRKDIEVFQRDLSEKSAKKMELRLKYERLKEEAEKQGMSLGDLEDEGKKK